RGQCRLRLQFLLRRVGRSFARPRVSRLEFNSQFVDREGVMWRRNIAVGAMIAAALMFAASAAPQSSPKSSRLTIEQLIDIKHPSTPVWSTDGIHVVFTWDRDGVANLYVAKAVGPGHQVPLLRFPKDTSEAASWMK